MKIPYTFDGSYSRCYLENANAMDVRHIFVLHAILSAWPFRHALELGSFWGASSTAFVEAINSGSPMKATFCDVDPSPGLLSVLKSCKVPGRCRLAQGTTVEALSEHEEFDFILVDAAHDLDSVTPEIELLVKRRPLCVVAHDTNASLAGYSRAEGAILLAETFRRLPGYQCLEDCSSRDGERTERGLFCATTSPDLYTIAARAFEEFL